MKLRRHLGVAVFDLIVGGGIPAGMAWFFGAPSWAIYLTYLLGLYHSRSITWKTDILEALGQ